MVHEHLYVLALASLGCVDVYLPVRNLCLFIPLLLIFVVIPF